MLKDIVFEIGTEELPAFELHKAIEQVDKMINGQSGKLFDYESTQIFSTPRRIIVCINGMPESIEAKREEYKGPKLEIAMVDGQYSKAAIGFAKGKGVDVDDLIQKDGCVYAVKDIPEQKIMDMLPDLLLNVINGISWKKVQRWGSFNEEFARPIRWLFAMFGDQVIDIEYAGLKSSNVSYGHRFLAPQKIECSNANDLICALESAYIVKSEEERENIIRDQVKKIEANSGLVAQLPANIMQEVVNLTEYPTCMMGQFDDKFLAVPKEIIVDAMLVHQRYFPLFEKSGELSNKFIIVSNGNPDCAETIIDGNERVVAARLYDAKFFFEEDQKKPLESFVEHLDEVVFQEQLGSMKNKAHRISELSKKIATEAGLSEDDVADAARAGLLAKADLVTNAVVEFTQVQGIMGSYYALSSGENKKVSDAIKEHYMPRFSGDDVPQTDVAKCVALADKIDTLCGMFAIDQAPTGSSDPFALRRGAIGLISIIQSGLNFSLIDAIKFSLNLYKDDGIKFDQEQVFEQIVDFIITRTKVILKDLSVDHDSIEAVSAVNVYEPIVFINRAKALDNARKSDAETFEDLATAFARANNLRDAALGLDVDISLLQGAENDLYTSVKACHDKIEQLLKQNKYSESLSELASLRLPIDKFFDEVLIMDEDEKLKNNRLKLLNYFVDVFAGIADFSKMAKTK